MDFTDFTTNDREVEFVLPGGKKTGFFLTLRYESSDEVEAVNRKYRGKLFEESAKGRNGDRQRVIDQHLAERRYAHVAGWRWTEGGATFNKEQPEFSPKKLREMLDHPGQFSFFLKEFIDAETASANDFLDGAEKD